MLNRFFLACDWYHSPPLDVLPSDLGPWLLDAGSFMQRLRQHGVQAPKVQVIKQIWAMPARNEKIVLDMTTRAYALIREVLIYSAEKKWMYARTVFPAATLTGKQRCLARLKERSLGSILFKDPSLQRSVFDVALLSSHTAINQTICNRLKINPVDLWARRSEFVLHNKSLLLTEIFLPDMKSLC